MENATKTEAGRVWLIRLPEVYREFEAEILKDMGVEKVKAMGRDYVLVKVGPDGLKNERGVKKYVSWMVPVDHSWPCSPQKVDRFIEKAAQAMVEKFQGQSLQALVVGSLDPGERDQYHRKLASNLRGRALQVFGAQMGDTCGVEEQDPHKPSLYVMVGKEGLYAGVATPQASGGYYPGGTKYIKQSDPNVVSRAGAKVVEALHLLSLDRSQPGPGEHWLELGASPGGMTVELLQRGYRVTAVDRAALDERVLKMAGLKAVVADAGEFEPEKGVVYGAILSDMNGDPCESLRRVARFVSRLQAGGLVIFTFKTAGCEGYEAIWQVEQELDGIANAAGLARVGTRHLTYNRREFTCFFEKREK